MRANPDPASAACRRARFLPAGDRRAVERVAVLELVQVDLLGRHDTCCSARVSVEAEVNEADLVVAII